MHTGDRLLTAPALTLASHALSLLAQASSPATGPAGAPTTGPTTPAPWYVQNPLLIPMIVVVGLMLIMSRSTKKSQEKQQARMLDNLKKNDRVQTIGGVLGTVIEVREGKVQLKVDETSNTKIWFSRKAVHRVLGEDGAETK